MCMLCTHGKGSRVWEGWHGREKEEEEEEYCHFPVLGEGQRVRKMMKEFPAGLFLLFDRFFLLLRISFFISVIFSFPRFLFSVSFALTVFFCHSASRSGSALFTHGVRECGSFPFRFWQREETLVPSQALISALTKNWLFMTTNSVTLCSFVSIPVLLPVFSFSHFLCSLEDSRSCSSLLLPSLTLGGCSSCLRTDCFVAAGVWGVNETLVSLVGERESQFSICNHDMLVL